MNEHIENNPGCMSALHLAAVDGDLAQVKQLLKNGANPNALNTDEQPPLFSALERTGTENPEQIAAREEIFKLLWEATNAGTRLSQDKEGNTALQLMIVSGFDQLVRDILKHAPDLVSCCMRTTGEAPIHTAILNNRLNIAKILFSFDPETANYKTSDLQSPLHYAVRYASKAMVKLCCEHQKGKINEKDRAGKTALTWATENNRTEIQDYLIDQGADINLISSLATSMRR